VEARVEGRFVDFVIDTGASLVVLRESSAALAGIRPQLHDYTATAVTANGKIKAARATIDRIEVGGITVYDVPAMVLPDHALAKNLLGVSFLSRLKRYEYANGRLVLEQ
jgi:aspartyl protease family protein